MNQAEPLILTPHKAIFERFPNLVRQAAELSQAYADQKLLVTDAALVAIGAELWQALDAEEQLQTAKQQAGQAILPLVIASDNSEILHLPWETLYHPVYGFLARNEAFTLSRTISSITNGLPDIEPGPLRVLLFSSLPDNLGEDDQLQIEKEQGQVLEALGQWRQSGHVVLEMPDDGRFSEFKRTLKSFKPHLVYLSGHGVFKSDPLNHSHKGYFLFEHEYGDAGELVDEDQLAEAFTGTGVQGIILSACQTGKAVSANLNNGLMCSLAQKGIPHVIGMRESILDRAGIQFAHAFFEVLIDKKGIALALQEARQAIKLPLKDDEDAKKSILAELSLGQWCLPMLLCREHDRPLINWQFKPQPMRAANLLNESLDRISLPAQFIGRRRELRKLQREFRDGKDGKTNVLLFTGAGGMGKTALAGKLINTLKVDGFEIFGFSAKAEHDWRDTIFQMKLSLDKERIEKYTLIQQQYTDPAKQGSWLLKLMLEQFQRKVVIFFDNLESVQDTATRTITDPELLIWINAAVGLKKEGLKVVLTSRWALPEWTEPVHPLGKPVYRDFLAVAQQQKLPKSFLRESKRLRKAYEILNGNYRALEFFAAALQDMDAGEEAIFLQQLQKAEAEIQVDMALEKVWNHRTAEEQELLRRMIAFEVPVAVEGVQKLAMNDPQQPLEAMEILLSVSLIERYYNQKQKTDEFLVSSLVRSWLEKQGIAKPELELLHQAATYHEWLLKHERQTLDQAIITHTALMSAGMDEEAHRITLDWIVEPMNTAGMYKSLLEKWLPPVCYSANPKQRSDAFNQQGKLYIQIGQYDTAHEFLNRSLEIRQQFKDKKGEVITLSNISLIYKARGDYDIALDYLKKSLEVQKQLDDRQGEFLILNNCGLIYSAKGDYKIAIEYFEQSLDICQQIGCNNGRGIILNNIGEIYRVWGNLSTALMYFNESFLITKQLNDKSNESMILNNISLIHRLEKNYDTALDILKQSLAICQQIGDKKGEGAAFNNISQVYKDQGNLNTALDYLKQSLDISQKIGERELEAMVLNNIAAIFYDRGDYQNALNYLNRSTEIRKQIGDNAGLCFSFFNIGYIHKQNKDFSKAISSWTKAYKLARQMNLAEVLKLFDSLSAEIGESYGVEGWDKMAKQMDKT